MQRNYILIIIAIAIVCFAAGYWLATPAGKVKAPELGVVAHVVSVRDTSSSEIYRVMGEYPQFQNASGPFNASIADFVNANLADFKKSSNENWQARLDTMPAGSKNNLPPQSFYFSSTWSPEQINDRYISVIVRLNYFNGGANETQLLKTFNYDVARGKTMTLADIFPNVPTYLKQISDITIQELASAETDASEGHPALDMIQAGAAPTADNYANFVFNDDVVNIYFPKYQVAPGSFGEQRALIVRSTIR